VIARSLCFSLARAQKLLTLLCVTVCFGELFYETIVLRSRSNQILQLAHGGDLEALRAALDGSGKDEINSIAGFGTPLSHAVMNGHLECVDLLMQRGANPGLGCLSNWTPLHYACVYGQLGAAKRLIAYGCDLNPTCDGGLTPLWMAIACSNDGVASHLIDQGADVCILPPKPVFVDEVYDDARIRARLAQLAIVAKKRHAAALLDLVLTMASLELPICMSDACVRAM
jgi:ankyrin repeat protein